MHIFDNIFSSKPEYFVQQYIIYNGKARSNLRRHNRTHKAIIIEMYNFQTLIKFYNVHILLHCLCSKVLTKYMPPIFIYRGNLSYMF